jgi:thiamine monophosphate synthase
MASRCQLYLAMPASLAANPSLIETALAAASAPSLLVMGEGDLKRLAAIIEAAHRQNATVLTDNPQVWASVQGFDGLHSTGGVQALEAARAAVGSEGVVGTESHLSRHEAMMFAEAGADYVGFGRGAEVSGEALDDLAEMVDWWSMLIEIPCAVHLPAGAGETAWRKLVAAGADFIIPGLDLWDEPKEVRHRLERLASYCGAEDVQAHL